MILHRESREPREWDWPPSSTRRRSEAPAYAEASAGQDGEAGKRRKTESSGKKMGAKIFLWPRISRISRIRFFTRKPFVHRPSHKKLPPSLGSFDGTSRPGKQRHGGTETMILHRESPLCILRSPSSRLPAPRFHAPRSALCKRAWLRRRVGNMWLCGTDPFPARKLCRQNVYTTERVPTRAAGVVKTSTR
jgi:hypothetical protein